MENDSLVQLANKLLHRLELPYRLSRAEECDSSIFIQTFSRIAPLIGGEWPEEVPVEKSRPRGKRLQREESLSRIQLILDTLLAMLSTDLSHINAKAVVDGDAIARTYLLQIFLWVLDYIDEIGSQLRQAQDSEHNASESFPLARSLTSPSLSCSSLSSDLSDTQAVLTLRSSERQARKATPRRSRSKATATSSHNPPSTTGARVAEGHACSSGSLYSVSDLADADISSAESRDGRDPNHRHSPHRVLAGDISVSSIPSDSSHGTLRRTHQPEATGLDSTGKRTRRRHHHWDADVVAGAPSSRREKKHEGQVLVLDSPVRKAAEPIQPVSSTPKKPSVARRIDSSLTGSTSASRHSSSTTGHGSSEVNATTHSETYQQPDSGVIATGSSIANTSTYITSPLQMLSSDADRQTRHPVVPNSTAGEISMPIASTCSKVHQSRRSRHSARQHSNVIGRMPNHGPDSAAVPVSSSLATTVAPAASGGYVIGQHKLHQLRHAVGDSRLEGGEGITSSSEDTSELLRGVPNSGLSGSTSLSTTELLRTYDYDIPGLHDASHIGGHLPRTVVGHTSFTSSTRPRSEVVAGPGGGSSQRPQSRVQLDFTAPATSSVMHTDTHAYVAQPTSTGVNHDPLPVATSGNGARSSAACSSNATSHQSGHPGVASMSRTRATANAQHTQSGVISNTVPQQSTAVGCASTTTTTLQDVQSASSHGSQYAISVLNTPHAAPTSTTGSNSRHSSAPALPNFSASKGGSAEVPMAHGKVAHSASDRKATQQTRPSSQRQVRVAPVSRPATRDAASATNPHTLTGQPRHGDSARSGRNSRQHAPPSHHDRDMTPTRTVAKSAENGHLSDGSLGVKSPLRPTRTSSALPSSSSRPSTRSNVDSGRANGISAGPTTHPTTGSGADSDSSVYSEDEASTSPPTRRRSQRLSCGRRRVAVSSPSAPVRKTRNQYALAEERIRDISRGYRGELSRFRSRTRSITAAEATADQGAKSGKQPARRAVEYGLDGRPIVKKSSHSRRTSVVSSRRRLLGAPTPGGRTPTARNAASALKTSAGGSRPSVSARSPLVRHRHASPVQQRRRKPNSPAISSPEKSQSDVDDTGPVPLSAGLLPVMKDRFPHVQVTRETAQKILKQQNRQMMSLVNQRISERSKPSHPAKLVAEAERRQSQVVNLLKKEISHAQRLQDQRNLAARQREVSARLRDRRHASARAHRYYNDFEMKLRSKLAKQRNAEEQIFRKLFEDGLALQRSRIRELRSYAKEKGKEYASQLENDIDSMENYYRDQFSMLAEVMDKEKRNESIRQSEQAKAVDRLKRELRQKMESDIVRLQEALDHSEEKDAAYVRQLEADRLRHELQLMERPLRL